MPTTHDDEVSALQLVRELLDDVRTLMRQEAALARTELREELGQVLTSLVVIAVAAGTLAIAGLWILIAVTRWIAYALGWPEAGVYAGVGGALAIIGLVLLAIARHALRTLRLLPKTRETLREPARWASRGVKESA
jgi:putative superfamily III holin-X